MTKSFGLFCPQEYSFQTTLLIFKTRLQLYKIEITYTIYKLPKK